MDSLGKTLVAIGGVLLLLGIIMLFLERIPGVGKLPGDILIKRENFSFYFPLTTCLLLSVILSLIMYFFNRR
jgi:hypothetical protein